MAEAPRPKTTRGTPDRTAEAPVTTVIATPTAMSATALTTMEAMIAGGPLATRKVATGTIAPR